MTVRHLKLHFIEQLKNLYPETEIFSFFYRLCGYKLSLNRIDLALNPNKNITTKDKSFFTETINRLKNYEPLQYIIGTTEFYGLPFKVDKNVLIPRPETEELISWILDDFQNISKSNVNLSNIILSEVEGKVKGIAKSQQPKANNYKILDIGTGSGCIAIALAKNLPKAEVWALDISKKAIKIAQQNADLNNVKINFIEADILNLAAITKKETVIAHKVKQSLTNKKIASVAKLPRKDKHNVTSSAVKKYPPLNFDIIVSNPPYVKNDEKPLIKPNVLKHEPHLALFVKDDNPLIFYDKIADFSTKYLTQNGLLFFEINQYLGKDLVSLLKQKSFTNIEIKQDLFEVDRMVKAIYHSGR